MKRIDTSLPDVFEILPDIFPDERGIFFESYSKKKLNELGITCDFVQDNVSISKKGVLRGLHFQTDAFAQDKLVSVLSGKVFDVAVDIRANSPTYGKWTSVILEAQKHNMFFIPKGFAHGFYVLSEEVKFFYKCSNYYNKEASSGIRYDDPQIGIEWPLEGEPLLSPQDAALPTFS